MFAQRLQASGALLFRPNRQERTFIHGAMKAAPARNKINNTDCNNKAACVMAEIAKKKYAHPSIRLTPLYCKRTAPNTKTRRMTLPQQSVGFAMRPHKSKRTHGRIMRFTPSAHFH
jgi:hypothetical protein